MRLKPNTAAILIIIFLIIRLLPFITQDKNVKRFADTAQVR